MHIRGHEAIIAQDDAFDVIFSRSIAKSKGSGYHSLLLGRVREAITGVENAQIVGVLNVPLAEVEPDGESLGEEVECIQGFCLRFSNGWNVC